MRSGERRPSRPLRAGTAATTFLLAAIVVPAVAGGPFVPGVHQNTGPAVDQGRRMYREGILPSGESMAGIVSGDVRLTGEQVICGACHRRSGLGAAEGQEVAPAVVGDILYRPLRIPTSSEPLAPLQRPAYTDEMLKRAIRDGIDANGEPLDALMPRYPLTDAELDILLAYLKSLSIAPSPGVTDKEIHFATLVGDRVDPATRKAFLEVFEHFFALKNTETRHEGSRAANPPWHKEWIFGPYRKWVLHVWDLRGPPETWPAQLEKHYQEEPVFALLSGIAPGPWQPVHTFCEDNQIPCLFPVTDLPVIEEGDFYSVYFTRGMALEADAVARHLADDGLLSRPVTQVFRPADPRSAAAAARLRRNVAARGGHVRDLEVPDTVAPGAGFWSSLAEDNDAGTLVVWLGTDDLADLWASAGPDARQRVYVSISLAELDPAKVPSKLRESLFVVVPRELPGRLPRLLARSTGWFKAKHIYAPGAREVQGDVYFTLKMTLGALIQMRGFFLRDYLLERIEHMVDSANYTSVYPRVSLAPGQRFVSRSAYIAQLPSDGGKGLVAVTDWRVP